MLLGDQIKSRRKAEKLSAEALAEKLRVSKDNIYKWEKGTKPSDPEDYVKIKAWLDSKLEEIPNIPIEKPVNNFDYQQAYVEELKEKTEMLKDQVRFLQRIIESNLISIGEQQQVLQAEVQAIQQWDAQTAAKGVGEKEAAYLTHIHKLTADNMKRLRKKNKPVEDGR